MWRFVMQIRINVLAMELFILTQIIIRLQYWSQVGTIKLI